MTKGYQSTPQHQCIEKAAEIVNLELVEGGTYGYETQMEGMLIPWPAPNFEEGQRIIKYESDVVMYNYTCEWSRFRAKLPFEVITEADNVTWFSPWNAFESQSITYASGMTHP